MYIDYKENAINFAQILRGVANGIEAGTIKLESSDMQYLRSQWAESPLDSIKFYNPQFIGLEIAMKLKFQEVNVPIYEIPQDFSTPVD